MKHIYLKLSFQGYDNGFKLLRIFIYLFRSVVYLLEKDRIKFL